MTDTIQKDVATGEENVVEDVSDEQYVDEDFVSDQDQNRLDIYKKSRREQPTDGGEEDEAGESEDDDQPGTSEADDTETEQKTDEVEDDQPTDESIESYDDDELVALKVNGREVFRTRKQVEDAGGIAAIQKQIAASESHRQVSEERKRLEQERLRFEEEKRQFNQRHQEEQQAQQDAEIDAEAARLAEGVLLGQEGELQEVIKNSLKAARQAGVQIDTSQIVAQAKEEVRVESYQRDVKEAVEEFEENYQDIAGNQQLRDEADKETIILQEENPDWSPRKIIKEAAKRVRARHKSTSLEEKKEGKEKASSTTPKVSARGKGKPQYKPKTKSEVVQGIAAGRPHNN